MKWWAIALWMIAQLGCVDDASIALRDDGGVVDDVGVVKAGGDDVGVVDAGPVLAACGEEFVAAEANFPDAGPTTLCQPLTADGVGIDVTACVPEFTVASGNAVLSLGVSGYGTSFSTLGPVMLAVSVIGVGPPCAPAEGYSNGYCSYRTGPRFCRAVVTRAGRPGDTVEAEIREPCRVYADYGGEDLIVDRLRVRGVLRLRYELTYTTHVDGGIPRAPECGVP